MAADRPSPGTPADPPPAEVRAELSDAPPFLSWRRIYLIVVGALAAEVIVFFLVTAAYR
jgi:hypothetical protein